MCSDAFRLFLSGVSLLAFAAGCSKQPGTAGSATPSEAKPTPAVAAGEQGPLFELTTDDNPDTGVGLPWTAADFAGRWEGAPKDRPDFQHILTVTPDGLFTLHRGDKEQKGTWKIEDRAVADKTAKFLSGTHQSEGNDVTVTGALSKSRRMMFLYWTNRGSNAQTP